MNMVGSCSTTNNVASNSQKLPTWEVILLRNKGCKLFISNYEIILTILSETSGSWNILSEEVCKLNIVSGGILNMNF